ncbi:MAG: YbjQ family protein [Vulcanibacillus sp.]
MIIVNIENVPGYKITKVHGLVKGNIVQSKHIGKDIIAGFRTIVGGEIKEYTEMLTDARQKSTALMVEEAKQLGANAIVKVTYTTSQIMQNASEIMAYGTAVTLEEE